MFGGCGDRPTEALVSERLGGESALKGVPGFILGDVGAGRGRERTQSTKTPKDEGGGEKLARFPPKISELSEKFANELRKSIERRDDTLLHLIDDTANLRGRAEAAAKSLQSAIDLFPVVSDGLRHTISVRSKERPGSPGNIYVALRSKGGGRDSLMSLTESDTARARQELERLLGQANAEEVLNALQQVQSVTEEMKRLGSLSVAFPTEHKICGASSLPSWIESASQFGELCAVVLATKVRRFESIDAELNDHVFEFNAKRQPVRYRSIICRADINEADPLGPTEPRFRVVTYISRRTGKRNSVPVKEYKSKIAKRRALHELARSLDASPTDDAVEKAVANRRKRVCSPWITKELISHCYLGKHTVQIMNKQKLIAGAMEQWLTLRQLFQHLLHK